MKKCIILVVDDDKVLLKMLESLLFREGYSVIPVSRGKEAIRIAKERNPSLVILDIMMPDIDGCEVANILKNDPETMNIPIMFLSSLITKYEEKNSRDKNNICLMPKPYNREDLLEKIRHYIS
jgi:CheY-like chemotaxis protein